jgi:hypothetical protein
MYLKCRAQCGGTENAATDKDDDDRIVVTARKEARLIINRIVDQC